MMKEFNWKPVKTQKELEEVCQNWLAVNSKKGNIKGIKRAISKKIDAAGKIAIFFALYNLLACSFA